VNFLSVASHFFGLGCGVFGSHRQTVRQCYMDHGKDSDEILTHRPAWLTGEGLSPNRVCTKPC